MTAWVSVQSRQGSAVPLDLFLFLMRFFGSWGRDIRSDQGQGCIGGPRTVTVTVGLNGLPELSFRPSLSLGGPSR